jgi:hypothetical protein
MLKAPIKNAPKIAILSDSKHCCSTATTPYANANSLYNPIQNPTQSTYLLPLSPAKKHLHIQIKHLLSCVYKICW